MCYSYRDREAEEEVRKIRQEDRKRREEWAKKTEKERVPERKRKLVRA